MSELTVDEYDADYDGYDGTDSFIVDGALPLRILNINFKSLLPQNFFRWER